MREGNHTKSLYEPEPDPRHLRALPRDIRDAVEATSRLNAALGATQPPKTTLHIQPRTVSDPRVVEFPVAFHESLSARDTSTTSKTVLASPFQRVFRQSKQPISSAVRMQSISGSDLETFDFSVYLHKELLDQHPTFDANFYTDSVLSLSGNTRDETFESPDHLKGSLFPVLNQHASTASDSVPPTLSLRDRYAVTAGPHQYTSAIRPLRVDSSSNGISTTNNSTTFGYPNKKRPRRPDRAKKACNRCRKKKTRCIGNGDEDCIPPKILRSKNTCDPRRKKNILYVPKDEEESVPPNQIRQ